MGRTSNKIKKERQDAAEAKDARRLQSYRKKTITIGDNEITSKISENVEIRRIREIRCLIPKKGAQQKTLSLQEKVGAKGRSVFENPIFQYSAMFANKEGEKDCLPEDSSHLLLLIVLLVQRRSASNPQG